MHISLQQNRNTTSAAKCRISAFVISITTKTLCHNHEDQIDVTSHDRQELVLADPEKQALLSFSKKVKILHSLLQSKNLPVQHNNIKKYFNYLIDENPFHNVTEFTSFI